jgi:hypothetical protein
MKHFALTCIALAAVTSAHAEFLTGNDLLAKLSDKTDTVPYSMALGYVSGVHDAGRSVAHCSPSTVTVGQVGDMTRLFLERTPTTREKSADVLVLAMLKAVWPCADKAPAGSRML